MNSGDAGNRRPYDSPRRRDQVRRTRAAVLAAAHEAFLARGYAGTTMREIAAAAGVAVQRVEQLFGSKRRVLEAVVDVTTAGDDEPVAMLDRPEQRAVEATAGVDAFLVAAGDRIGVVAGRMAGVLAVVDQAAAGDPDVAAFARRHDERRRVVAAWVVDGVAARAPLRLARERAVDSVWVLLDPAVHRRLLRDRGWPAGELGAWFADAVRRLLVADDS